MEKTEWGAEPEFFGPRHYYRETILKNKVLNNLKEGNLLDTGFGNGSLSIRLSQGKYNITGIDFSEKFVRHVKEKIKDMLNINIMQGDITNLRFEDNSFDGVLCSEILEHIGEDQKAIQECYRVLKKGGFLFISVPANPKLWDKSDIWAGHHRRYTKDLLNYLLIKNKFKVKEIHHWGFPITRTYHKLIYLRTLDKSKIKNSKIKEHSKILSNIFKIDSLFNKLPYGIGLIAVAQK